MIGSSSSQQSRVAEVRSAELEGTYWNRGALDWDIVQQRTVYPVSMAVLDELDSWPGRTLLDIGCGSGEFARLAADRGARVHGLDASSMLIEIAQKKNPAATFRVGDMECLPYSTDRFSVVTAFNSLHFAHDPVDAISEAIRVTQPGGRIVVATWGPAADCDAVCYFLDLGGLMPPEPRARTAGDNADPEVLRGLAQRGGLVPSQWRVVPCPWEYDSLDTALRGLLSTGPAARAIEHSGREQVAATIAAAIEPYQRGDGSYLLSNTCYYLIGTKES